MPGDRFVLYKPGGTWICEHVLVTPIENLPAVGIIMFEITLFNTIEEVRQYFYDIENILHTPDLCHAFKFKIDCWLR